MAEPPFAPPKDPGPVAPAAFGLRQVRLGLLTLLVMTIPVLFGLQWLSNAPRFHAATGLTHADLEAWIGWVARLDVAFFLAAVVIAKLETLRTVIDGDG